ncbi:hypothetical protein MmTuc01_0309 [Methanosarcina mazei Tuc01]|uniref:Uncharacterized protein n=1 Tax=Methanosarcina mazei Tuc01 TaxID=1236903 RepID=M1Q6I6_METMZ|nr:hypothetical protein [Methanosarcina mazei]AGF95758.1 hypothetical protein MmTuc01_0309 [Methanosarcina mazei Tuc01]
MFTMENTEGFDQKTLDKMNAEVKKSMSKSIENFFIFRTLIFSYDFLQ